MYVINCYLFHSCNELLHFCVLCYLHSYHCDFSLFNYYSVNESCREYFENDILITSHPLPTFLPFNSFYVRLFFMRLKFFVYLNPLKTVRTFSARFVRLWDITTKLQASTYRTVDSWFIRICKWLVLFIS